MRKVRLFIATSLDGFIARPDGGVDWLFQDGDYGMSAFYRSIDTVLVGRKTHDLMLRHGFTSYPGMRNYVFSRTPQRSTDPNVEFVSGGVGAFAKRLRRTKGKDVWLVGGGELVESFLEARAIDEVMLAVHPIILGEGISLFRSMPRSVPLRLVRCRPYRTGLVLLHYAVEPRAAKPARRQRKGTR